jgi:hypothetical protein
LAVQTTPEQTISELVRKTQELETKVADLLARIETLETWKATGSNVTDYYVCNNDATYDATNSKKFSATNGLITSME